MFTWCFAAAVRRFTALVFGKPANEPVLTSFIAADHRDDPPLRTPQILRMGQSFVRHFYSVCNCTIGRMK
jgi:hypothetical protein